MTARQHLGQHRLSRRERLLRYRRPASRYRPDRLCWGAQVFVEPVPTFGSYDFEYAWLVSALNPPDKNSGELGVRATDFYSWIPGGSLVLSLGVAHWIKVWRHCSEKR